MSINEAQRRQVFDDLERTLGPESAEIVMDQVFAVDRHDVARQSAMDAQFVAIRGEMGELRGEMKRLAAMGFVHAVTASIATAGLVLAARSIS